MGGYCWYFGESNQSCTAVCSSRGGYHEATKDYAGSAGDAVNCQAITDAFSGGLMGPVFTDPSCPSGLGCSVGGGGSVSVYCSAPQTSEGASYPDAFRICACQN